MLEKVSIFLINCILKDQKQRLGIYAKVAANTTNYLDTNGYLRLRTLVLALK